MADRSSIALQIPWNYHTRKGKIDIPKVILTYVIILLGSSAFFVYEVLYLVVFFIISFFLFIMKREKFSREFLYIALALVILTIANIVIYQFFSYRTSLGAFVRFLMPFFMLRVIGRRFPDYFILLMKILTIISFLFYFPSIIIPGFIDSLVVIPEILRTDPVQGLHFIIYTIEFDQPMGLEIYRNAGPCGEPGEFAGYLMLALIMNIILTRKLWNATNLFFMLAVVTTFSTMGYLALFVLIIAFYIITTKRIIRLIWLPLLIFAAIQVYYRVDFLHEKISIETEIVTESKLDDVARVGRLPNLWNNLMDSFDNPIFGKGRNYSTRYEDYSSMDPWEFSASLFDLAADFGWPFFILYFFLIFRSFKTLCLHNQFNPRFSYFIILILFILYTAQNYQYQSAFLSLIYLRNALHSR